MCQDISAAVISAWRKDEMRTKLKAIKKLVDDADKTRKAAMMQRVSRAYLLLLSYSILRNVAFKNVDLDRLNYEKSKV